MLVASTAFIKFGVYLQSNIFLTFWCCYFLNLSPKLTKNNTNFSSILNVQQEHTIQTSDDLEVVSQFSGLTPPSTDYLPAPGATQTLRTF